MNVNKQIIILKLKKVNYFRGTVLLKREHFRKKRSKTAPGDAKMSVLCGRDAGGGSLLSLQAQIPFTAFPGIISLRDIYSLCSSPPSTTSPTVPTLLLSPPARKSSNTSIPAKLELPRFI